MPIELNHTIVPARDKIAAATFLSKILDLSFDKHEAGRFAPLRINDTLTLDYADETEFESHHYAFKVSETDFDAMFSRIKTAGIAYGSGPPNPFDDMKINHRRGGRGVYFRDPDGHVFELLTKG
jgi:catechol 2,3-dioxygenase-like lactoylglutathione lyase family enzyme